MAIKVLIFESDHAFAGELRTELSRLGVIAQIVDDGYTGLMAAASEKPDLILLSIELPRMNGFSVCNKLKKDPALKAVPLIIMSSESSDDTFEQHRKLRTRAEDYVHKPIAFGELLEHMRPYVPFGNGEGTIDDDTAIIIDDSELSGGLSSGALRVEAEVAAFADTAFDRLLDTDDITLQREGNGERIDDSAAEIRIGVPRAAKTSIPPRPTIDAEVERLQKEFERQKTDNARLERELSTARAEAQRLEQTLQSEAASNEQVVRLQRELDEIRLKATSGQRIGGVSSREFLDLREGLNKKDKEILALRDQIGRKEKDLLDASDTALALEREKADLDDKISALEKDVLGAKALAETARADKEQAAKRADDFKLRSEKLKADLEAKTADLAGIQSKHDEEMAAALESLRESAQRAQAEAMARLEEQAEEARRSALESREAELAKETDLRLAALLQAHEEEQTRLKTDLAAAREDAENSRRRLEERERELDDKRQADLDGQKRELEGHHTSKVREVEAREADLAAELSTRSEERDLLARDLAQVKERAGQLESGLGEAKSDLSAAREKVGELTQKLETAHSNWNQNKAALEHAKDALAAAVAQIDEAETRGI